MQRQAIKAGVVIRAGIQVTREANIAARGIIMLEADITAKADDVRMPAGTGAGMDTAIIAPCLSAMVMGASRARAARAENGKMGITAARDHVRKPLSTCRPGDRFSVTRLVGARTGIRERLLGNGADTPVANAPGHGTFAIAMRRTAAQTAAID